MILSAFLDHPSLESNEMKEVSVLAAIVMQTISCSQLCLHYRMFESRVVGWAGVMVYTYHPRSQEAEATCLITQ